MKGELPWLRRRVDGERERRDLAAKLLGCLLAWMSVDDNRLKGCVRSSKAEIIEGVEGGVEEVA